ncbi:hypothetical protein ACGFX4_26680 [Kitasatospora sp. NPDC048365]|uniref:hypothetical protein n=1 Tax=Kitasatospora sp. NPDC048365 TaxID=3364050 RepID=UPI0037163CB2
MRASAFLYPWDVVGDPAAPAAVAELGLQQVTLASAYHSTRALTPRHPTRRIVTARHSAVYYPPATERWRGRALRPHGQSWIPSVDPFGDAADALTAAGLEVHAWVVLAHNSLLGQAVPRCTVENAYGERYPWALCIAQEEVVEYCASLAAEASVRPGARGVELESCGWYGLAHLHAHDKIGGVGLGPVGQLLMSLCFCPACERGYGLGEKLRAAVREALEPLWRGAPEPAGGSEADGPAALLGPGPASAVLAHRLGAARELQRTVVGAVRAAAGPDFRILLHADPDPWRYGANVGVDVGWVLDHADGLVVPAALAARASAAPRRPGTVIAANSTVVAGMGGGAPVPDVPGADELRFYHVGLASDADLAALRAALRP